MVTGDMALIAGTIALGAFVYAIAGFGFALTAMPLLTLRLPVSEAVVLTFLLSPLNTWGQLATLWRQVEVHHAIRMSVAAAAGMPFGVLALALVGDRSLRLVLGVAVLVATALIARRVSLPDTGPVLEYAMGFVSGLGNTSVGINGPPVVLALQARGLRPDPFRATTAAIFAASNLIGLVLLAAAREVTQTALLGALVAAPSALIGFGLGVVVRPRVPERVFRSLVIALLVISGTTSIAAAV